MRPAERPTKSRRAGGRRGQALLIAVLLMTAILLVGILFVALVARNQEQSERHVDVVTAQALAEAGVRWTDRMLETSPLGADWRPKFVPYDPDVYDTEDPSTWPNPPAMYQDGTADPGFWGPDGIEGSDDDYYSDFDVLRGWHPVRAGSVSDPGGFIRRGFIRYPDPRGDVSVASAPSLVGFGRQGGYLLLRVTYDPDPPYEPGDTHEQKNLSNCIQIESIGRVSDTSTVFRRLVAYKPIGLTDHLRWVTNSTRSVNRAYLGLRPYADMDRSNVLEIGEYLKSPFDGPVRADAQLYLLGNEVTEGGSDVPSTEFLLRTEPGEDDDPNGGGYLRDDAIEATGGIYLLDDNADGVGVSINGTPEDTISSYIGPDQSSGITGVYTGTTDIPRIDAPDINAADPTTDLTRYRELTRNSGVTVRNSDGEIINTGELGFGNGIYIDNFSDIQYRQVDGTGNLTQLVQDWRNPERGASSFSGDSGWNAMGTTYSPPAVEIEFFPSRQAALQTCSQQSASEDAPTDPGVLWWPNHDNNPDYDPWPCIKITRHDKRWGLPIPASGDVSNVGKDSGENVIVMDFPEFPNQVIFAEGNVRVKGVLPPAAREDGDANGNGIANELIRDYNLTIVSNASIYIDGQILSPQDVHGRYDYINDSGPTVGRDEWDTDVALLARDFVCLNPTQLVPQLTSGMVPAALDEEFNADAGRHWELSPDAGGTAYSRWQLGEDLPADVRLHLTALQTGGDPGPAGMAVTLDDLTDANNPSGLNFGNPVDPYCFIFAPEGALLWGSIPSPTGYCSNAIAPDWQPPASVEPYTFADPNVPWNITPYVSTAAGDKSALGMFHRDPQLGTGATEYWLKKFKLEEMQEVASGVWRPRGAINAKVNALIYAQRGSWFVIPGAYFDANARAMDYDGDGTIQADERLWATRMLRYNYRITVRGCITEDHTANVEDVADWSNKWAFPIYSDGSTLGWGTIEYEFDDRLRVPRDQGITSLSGDVRSTTQRISSPQANLPKLPLLPVSDSLLYYGEVH